MCDSFLAAAAQNVERVCFLKRDFLWRRLRLPALLIGDGFASLNHLRSNPEVSECAAAHAAPLGRNRRGLSFESNLKQEIADLLDQR